MEVCLEGRESICGQDHPDTIASMVYLALYWRDQSEQEKMAELVARALSTVRKLADEDNVDNVNTGPSAPAYVSVDGRNGSALKSVFSCPPLLQKWEGATGDLVLTINTLIRINLRRGRVYQAACMEGILFQLLNQSKELD
jgi:hypothetical protein